MTQYPQTPEALIALLRLHPDPVSYIISLAPVIKDRWVRYHDDIFSQEWEEVRKRLWQTGKYDRWDTHRDKVEAAVGVVFEFKRVGWSHAQSDTAWSLHTLACCFMMEGVADEDLYIIAGPVVKLLNN